MVDLVKIYRKEMLNQLFLELAEVVAPETRTPRELNLRRDLEKYVIAMALITNNLEEDIAKIKARSIKAHNPTLILYEKILAMVEGTVEGIYV